MRKVIESQMEIGEQTIGSIRLDPKSRDDIPQILRGLQYIYTTPEVRERVFAILEQLRPVRQGGTEDGLVTADTGRPGMSQWKILVLGVLRLALNVDYDRIRELANEHNTIRQFLGHGEWDMADCYPMQTLRDNLRLFTPEVLDQINQEVVRAGHKALKKSPDEALAGRCDSFVVETNVHFPTDINLLLDAISKVIDLSSELADRHALPGWRQKAYHQCQFKRQYRTVQRLKHSTSKDENKRQARQQEVNEAYRTYLALAESHLARAEQTRQQAPAQDRQLGVPERLDEFMRHAYRQIDQIRRRVLHGESIAHGEKVFSLFEPHTEWISKGKAGVPVELGLRVCVMEDSDRFILHHRVMQRCTDDQMAIPMVEQTQTRFEQLRSVSMDKGFHSPANQQDLAERLERVVVPKKGRLSQADKTREHDEEFVRLRRRHSAVESAINALEVHGLDQCPDHGIEGFQRYVALAVVARNIQRLGAVLRKQEQDHARRRRRDPYRKAA